MEEFEDLKVDNEIININEIPVNDLNEKLDKLLENKKTISNEIKDILKLYK